MSQTTVLRRAIQPVLLCSLSVLITSCPPDPLDALPDSYVIGFEVDVETGAVRRVAPDEQAWSRSKASGCALPDESSSSFVVERNVIRVAQGARRASLRLDLEPDNELELDFCALFDSLAVVSFHERVAGQQRVWGYPDSRLEQRLVGFDLSRGHVRWEREFPMSTWRRAHMPEPGRILLSSGMESDTRMLYLDARTGEEIWPPIDLKDGWMMFGANGGDVAIVRTINFESAIELQTGRLLWQFPANEATYSPHPVGSFALSAAVQEAPSPNRLEALLSADVQLVIRDVHTGQHIRNVSIGTRPRYFSSVEISPLDHRRVRAELWSSRVVY